MEDFDKAPAIDRNESAKSPLSAEFGNMVAQLRESPLKPTGEGSSVLGPATINPLLPKLELPKIKLETPSPKIEAPSTTPVESQAVKVKEVADTLKNQSLPMNAVVSKVETAFKSETNSSTMQELAKRINAQLGGTGVSLEVQMIRNDPTNVSVAIKGTGRPFNVLIGAGTGRKEVAPAGPAAPSRRTDVPPPKPSDAPADIARDIAGTLKRNDIADALTKIEKSFKNEKTPASMAELAKLINNELKGSGFSIDVHPYRGSKFVMAVSISGAARPYEVPVGSGKSARWRR